MKGHSATRSVSVGLLVALAPWCGGCATEIHLRQSAGVVEGGRGGRLLVRVFENRSDRKRDVSTHRKIVTKLYRATGRADELVRKETEPRWSVADLPAGEYVLRVSMGTDEGGSAQPPASMQHEKFVVRANETTVADVVLSDPRNAWVGVLIGTAVVVALAHAINPLSGFSLR